MTRYRIIRPIIASFLLVLFALAIMPKVAIHALVAHHTDTPHPKHHHDHTDQLNLAAYQCAIDNLVAHSPFLDHDFSIALNIPALYPAQEAASLAAPLTCTHLLFGLRGPPALV